MWVKYFKYFNKIYVKRILQRRVLQLLCTYHVYIIILILFFVNYLFNTKYYILVTYIYISVFFYFKFVTFEFLNLYTQQVINVKLMIIFLYYIKIHDWQLHLQFQKFVKNNISMFIVWIHCIFMRVKKIYIL